MSILDDAIREHLALKRAHGADEGELKKLEDEAFGPPQRPDDVDPFAEAPTEFLTPEGGEAPGPEGEGGRRMPNIADLQEPPPPGAPAEERESPQEPQGPTEREAEATGAGDDARAAEAPRDDAPAVEDHPAMEHEALTAPPEPPAPPAEPPAAAEEPPPAESPSESLADSGPSTDERHAIADQPTQFFDVEAEIAGDSEPVLEEDEEDEEFWSEQRLSDELDQALEAPVTEEHEVAPPAEPEQPSEEHELAPAEESEGSRPDASEPAPEAVEDHVTDEDDDEDGADAPNFESRAGHEDVLEDTPEFLEDAPEDDELWFEQKPPKDFDFDD